LKPLVFMNVTVIDMTGAPPKPGRTVVVRGGRIAEIGVTGKVHAPKGASVVDGTGKFLIPGLWDMHVHTASLAPSARNEKIFFPMLLANGVTGVRDMGGDLEVLLAWRRRIEAGELLGPRIVASGAMLDGYVWPSSLAVANEAEGRRAVESLKRRGADFIKVQSLLARETYFAIAAEARREKISFAGHVPETVSVGEASDAGQKSVEHLTGVLHGCSTVGETLPKNLEATEQLLETYSDELAAALFARFRRNDTWQCPTLVWERGYLLADAETRDADKLLKFIPGEWVEKIWKPFMKDALKKRGARDEENLRRRLRRELQVVGAMQRAGVQILAGTDAPAPYIFPGFSLHEELTLLVEAGLTPMQALETATRNPARFLGRLDVLGTIERKKIADLILLEADPLADIKNTRKISAVVVGGRLFDKAQLQEMLSGAEAAARQN